MNHKLESRLPGEISLISDVDDSTIMAESKEGLKSLLMKVKQKSRKAGSKLSIQKTKITASSLRPMSQKIFQQIINGVCIYIASYPEGAQPSLRTD